MSGTGEGLTSDIIGQVFTTKAVGKGNDLGLGQVFGFVRQSGGHVKIHSAPGNGTTVRVHLPRLAGDLAATEATKGRT